MRRFLASAWFPTATCLVLAAATAGAYAVWFQGAGPGIGNDDIAKYAVPAGWAIGPAAGLLSLVLAFILNGIRRLCRVRKTAWLHPVVTLLALLPWCLFAWQMVMNEPRYTSIAKAVIDCAGKPLFLGCAAALAFIVLCSLLALIPTKNKR